jgi:hypothetical protein
MKQLVAQPALHFINVITGAVVSQNRSDTPVDERAHEAEPKAKGK